MEQTITSKGCVERYNQIPKEHRELIDLDITTQVVNEISTQIQLSEKQKTLLENEILYVLLFILPRYGFAERIAESLEIKPHEADIINKYIHEEIFNIVDDTLTLSDKEFSTTPKQIERTHGYGAFRAENPYEETVVSTPEPVHVSQQDQVLQPKPVADRPTYTPPPTHRN